MLKLISILSIGQLTSAGTVAPGAPVMVFALALIGLMLASMIRHRRAIHPSLQGYAHDLLP
ncbi:MAG: hypothetical protein V3V03_02110 [Hyphomonadaceae bacterium]